MNAQILALQEEYERMQAFVESRPADVYALNGDFYRQRLAELDAEIDEHMKAQDIIDANLPILIRNQETFDAWLDLLEAVAETPPEPQTAGEAHAAMLGDWPWTYDDWLSELDNRRPEVGF